MAMGKPSGSACRAMACACVAGGALASIVQPAGCRLCEQLLARASRLPGARIGLASFSRIRGSICRECGVPVDAVPGDNDAGGSGELLDDVCVGCRSEKSRFNRGFKQAELLAKRLAKRLGMPHQGILRLRKRPRPDKHLLTPNAR